MNNTCPRLIEISLPIREISAESVRDKNIHQAHIRNLHVWWARRPLATSRAVVFASLVPDPDNEECPAEFRDAVMHLLKNDVARILQTYCNNGKYFTDKDPYRPYKNILDTPRNRLLTFVAKWSPQQLAFESGTLAEYGKIKEPPPREILDDRCLVKWETSDPENEQGQAVLKIARELISIANGSKKPVVLDSFAGGGSIPLEAARLGTQSIANDYNPVAYLILRGTCEFPQKFGRPGKRVIERFEYGQETREEKEVDNVLIYDVEKWAKQILELARKEIGHLYQPGKDGIPVAGYLWARTAPCSNPSCRAEIPLLRNLLVCNKKNKRIALTIKVENKQIEFGIAKGREIKETAGTMIEKGRGAVQCPVCKQTTPVEDLRQAGLDKNMGERMVAVIINTPHGKDYRLPELSDIKSFEEAKMLSEKEEQPREEIPLNQGDVRPWLYGKFTWGSLFNPRQIVVMQTFIKCMHKIISLNRKEINDTDYLEAIEIYLGLWVSRIAAFGSSVCIWANTSEIIKNPFGRQAIPMNWDYPEANPFADSSGSASTQIKYMMDVIRHETPKHDTLPTQVIYGSAEHIDLLSSSCSVIVTDPPYFDLISYADLSDYFYIWLKRSLGPLLTKGFATPLSPKNDEVTAFKHRHNGDSIKANSHFTSKLAASFAEGKRLCAPDGVITVMFAHQSNEAWQALINALLEAGLNITGTYPIETELTSALKRDVSALASSITVICRPRELSSATSFHDVRQEIEHSVAESVHRFWEYGFRGADLIVACYGPAVGVFGRYSRVERADGTPVTVPELLDLARQSALKAIAGEFTGDPLSRLYFVWANLYGISEQSWDDARLVIQIGGESENAMEVARERSLFVVDGATCRLALLKDRINHKHLGNESDAPLIDQLHHAMQLWKEEKRADLVAYLRENALLDHVPYWKLAQALFEVLPRDEEDWKIIANLLGERETLRLEAKRGEQPIQKPLFDQ